MDLQTYITRAASIERQKRFDRSDQFSLGMLIDSVQEAVSRMDRDERGCDVWLDFEHLFPTEFGSWRGSYEELALRFTSSDFDYETNQMTAHEFLKLCKETVGKTFTGYKGGEYRMTRDTPVWIANRGNSGETALIGVDYDGYRLTLITGQRDF